MSALSRRLRALGDRLAGDPYERALARGAKERRRRIVFFWNRGLGDIALGLVPMFARAAERIPGASIEVVTRADLERLDVTMLMASLLDWDRQMRLAELAPPTIDTPSGRHVAIDYSRDHPTASVRVQDLFGVTAHPSVAGGTVAVSLELLSPADRPIQITSDLPGFWAGSWAEVRKEMAGRYPKHHWPVDPAVAPPKRMKDR